MKGGIGGVIESDRVCSSEWQGVIVDVVEAVVAGVFTCDSR